MSVLLTGGAGYIGTHTLVELLNSGNDAVVFDNYSNSKPEALERVKRITGRNFVSYEADMLDEEALDRIFSENEIDAVIHFAGLKAVGESVRQPLRYYYNNLTGTLNLCKVMVKHGVKRMVFSSSATVYRQPAVMPINEEAKLGTTCPYGETKLMIEKMLSDIAAADRKWSIAILRYFNPVGAHPSGLIGEDPQGIPNNLFPYITKVAQGKLPCLKIFGDDYPTTDGTGIRDYIHVVDLARAHLSALDYARLNAGVDYFNIGTGKGYSVFDLIHAYEKATGKNVPYKVTARRPGDVAICYADPTKAREILGWTAKLGIEDMCRDGDRWQTMNPDGYGN